MARLDEPRRRDLPHDGNLPEGRALLVGKPIEACRCLSAFKYRGGTRQISDGRLSPPPLRGRRIPERGGDAGADRVPAGIHHCGGSNTTAGFVYSDREDAWRIGPVSATSSGRVGSQESRPRLLTPGSWLPSSS